MEFLNELWDQGHYPQIQLMDGKMIFFRVIDTDPDDADGMDASEESASVFHDESYLFPIIDYVRLRYENSYNNPEAQQFGINWDINNFTLRLSLIEHLPILDKIYVVSDAPRRPVPFEHYHQDRLSKPEDGTMTRFDHKSHIELPAIGLDAYINLITFPDDKTRITVGREYNFQGFTKPVEYYNPDYSKAKLPEIKDYRRTLYWNPNVTTDNFGQASIEFYNNSVCNIIDVSAEGITRYGQFLVNE